ncbi:MAG: 50S ribosomal protein L29 [Methylococcales bacterium]
MKASELRKSTSVELNAMLVSLAKEQFNLRMQKGTQQLSKPDQIKKVRREIARVQTIVKELAGA